MEKTLAKESCVVMRERKRGAQNVNVMLSIYLRDMLREFVGRCISAQSPRHPLCPGATTGWILDEAQLHYQTVVIPAESLLPVFCPYDMRHGFLSFSITSHRFFV